MAQQPGGGGGAVLTSAGGAAAPPLAPPPPPLPAAAVAVRRVCSSMGVDAMEPRVARALLDFVHRYTADVLLTAEAYAGARERPSGEVDATDVTLALQTQAAAGGFCAPAPVADVAPLAAGLNAVPLPPVQRRFGLRLPPEADCLTQPNWQVDVFGGGGGGEDGGGGGGGGGGGAGGGGGMGGVTGRLPPRAPHPQGFRPPPALAGAGVGGGGAANGEDGGGGGGG
jgi:uncharacterized membrane protein YgcG